jgi:hypothetical protein
MPKYSSPIVGMYHHPPAQGILRAAPHNCPLTLRPEPTNPYDPNAIQVWLTTEGIPPDNHDKLREELQGFGVSMDVFLGESEWFLGFVPRGVAAIIHLDGDVPGTLSFDPQGKPLAIFQLTQVV